MNSTPQLMLPQPNFVVFRKTILLRSFCQEILPIDRLHRTVQRYMEELLIISGLIGVQVILAIYMLFLHEFLALGVNSLSLVIFGGLVSSLFLLPFAIAFEKKKWPARLSLLLIVQIVLVSVAGVAFQIFMLVGIKMTSPAIASAMPNIAPGIIFIFAASVRFEKFSVWCKYSRAKVIGTILCLGGAIIMSFLMSPPTPSNLTMSVNKTWMFGCFYLLCAVILLSFNTVLQAAAMLEFPAPLTLCVMNALLASLITALIQFSMEGKIIISSSSISLPTLLGIVLTGACVSSICVGFQTWCVKKKGPVLVSIFNPVQTIFSAVLSTFVLDQVLSLGSLAGMVLMFMGLYVVLWAKKKEDCEPTSTDLIGTKSRYHDIEKPLLV